MKTRPNIQSRIPFLSVVCAVLVVSLGARPASGMTDQDIGSVGVPGSSSFSNGTYTLSGSGDSFGGNSDKVHFTHLVGNGDCSITVRVASITGGNWSARAGIMIRENLTPASKMVFMGMFKGLGVFFQAHSQANDTWSNGYYGTGNEPVPQWVRLVRSGNLFTGYQSVDGTTWTTIGSHSVTMSAPIYAGLVVTSGQPTSLTTAVLDNLTMSGVPLWTGVDVGAVAIPGSTTDSGGIITQTASGASFWATTDQLRFAYQKVTGDCTIVSRLSGITGATSNNALSGVMIRESLSPASRHVFIGYSKDWRSYYVSHTSANDSWSTAQWGAPGSGPKWVKLTRAGNTITASLSSDGTTWTPAGSVLTAMSASTYVGLMMTSAMNTQLATALYDHVSLITPPNLAPVVSAGPDATVHWPASARTNLIGEVTDDGLSPGGSSPTATWSLVSGPGPVVFSSPGSSSTIATFSGAGNYVLRLTGSDGIKTTSDEITVNVSTAMVPPVTDLTSGLQLIEEVDAATYVPDYESSPGISQVQTILGKAARVVPPAATAQAISYVIGQGQALEAGAAYILSVEYPDDVPRTTYLVNRGSDYYRGWSTGKATGDIRDQFAEPAVESLNYPQTGQWQTHKQFFYLLNKFQGIVGKKEPEPGFRPYSPVDGFDVIFAQGKQIDDPRSSGMAIGKIRLYKVATPSSLYAPINYPPSTLPIRRIFWREEMADQIVQSGDPAQQAVPSSLDWYKAKMRMAKVLGINTFCKDLLEFGYNQGWQSGDQNWMVNAQPPNTDLWTNLVPLAAAEGMDVLPYFEYKTGVGISGTCLGKQFRAHKLYHNIYAVADPNPNSWYTCIWWSENANGDLTDPDTIADVKRMMDRTVLDLKSKGRFAGVWFRMRPTHLPMSFADPAIARFKTDLPGDQQAQSATQTTLIASYEGDRSLYNKYVNWWFGKRVQFLTTVRDYINTGLGQADSQVIFTPWIGEPVPVPHATGAYYGHPGVVTDDSAWWQAYRNSLPDGWAKWHWSPTDFALTGSTLYRERLEENSPINYSGNFDQQEIWHSSPGADPLNYTSVDGVMMTYPIGRLFTTVNASLMREYRSLAGLTVVRHFPLNEDNGNPASGPNPFGTLLGYISVDCDRAGHHMLLGQARSIANADPRNIAYLAGSSFSTGYPEIMRRFNQSFLAVPAMPSTVVPAASDPEVVVRKISTPANGTYYFVVNTSMNGKQNITISLPSSGSVVNLVSNEIMGGTTFNVNLDPAELRSYRVGD